MPENTENHDLITTAQESVTPHAIPADDTVGLYIVRDTDGQARVIDVRDKLGILPAHPDRKTGQITLTNVDSFIDALAKHGLPETELYANTKAGTIRAVINAHGFTSGGTEDAAGYGDHTITLALPATKDWQQWTAHDGKLMTQADFAEFIEDHLPNFVTPSGADMLELAQTFQATTKVDFASSQRIASGETQLLYTEEQNATAGKKGSLAIPDKFSLALQPFERGEAYRVEARFRYRINGGNLALGYRLTRPEDVLRDAFDQVIEFVQGQTSRTVWHA
ncbi:DUF2303 family protein [Ornithinimicrobium sp. LYQ92]|uniref:DUF2303 family protein n=1 Tax=Serinicoccus sp. LYQ92 TaxID=3378798 RepID=UPI003852A001